MEGYRQLNELNSSVGELCDNGDISSYELTLPGDSLSVEQPQLRLELLRDGIPDCFPLHNRGHNMEGPGGTWSDLVVAPSQFWALPGSLQPTPAQFSLPLSPNDSKSILQYDEYPDSFEIDNCPLADATIFNSASSSENHVETWWELTNSVILADCHKPEIMEKVTSRVEADSEVPARVNSKVYFPCSMRNSTYTDILRRFRRHDEISKTIFQNKLLSTKITYCPPTLPRTEGTDSSPLSDSNASMVAGDQGLICINVGKAPGREELVILNMLTKEVKVLPPLNHSRHPVLIHLTRVDDSRDQYEVVVAGSSVHDTAEDLSLKTEEYSSTRGEWKCTGDLPGPSFGLNEYQTGVCYKDNSENKFLFCVAIMDEKGTKGVLMYDFHKGQWRRSIKHPMCVGELRPNSVSRLGITHLVGCGGSIFLVSEQECCMEKYVCIHKLNSKRFEGDMTWEPVMRRKRTGTEPDSREVHRYPAFTGVPSSATVVECGGSVIVFSELEFIEEESEEESVFICIHLLNLEGSRDGQWEEVKKYKKPRYRAPNWKPWMITASLQLRVEVMGLKVGKSHWDHNSEGLETRYSIKRTPKQCENLSGTMLKSFLKIQNYLKSNNIQPGTSDWDNFWQTSGNEALLGVVNQERYELVEMIERGKKPRKKIGRVHEREVYAGVGLSSPSGFDDSANSSGIDLANPVDLLKHSFDLIKDRREVTMEQFIQIRKLKIEEMKESNKEKELQLEFLKLQERKKRGKKARDCADLRPRKSMKRST